MIDTQELHAYLYWRDHRAGREVDVSPEAYALENAAEVLVREGRDMLAMIEDMEPYLWSKFREALDDYVKAKENL